MPANSGTKRSDGTHPKKSKMGGSRPNAGQPRGRRMSATLLTTGLAAAAAASRGSSVASSCESSVEFSEMRDQSEITTDRGVGKTSFVQINKHAGADSKLSPTDSKFSPKQRNRIGGSTRDGADADTKESGFIQRVGRGKLAALAAGTVAVVGAGLD